MDGNNFDKNLPGEGGGLEENVSDQKTLALLSWIFPIIGVVLFFVPDTKKKSFLFHHSRQIVGYSIAAIVLGIGLTIVISILTAIATQIPSVGSVLGCLLGLVPFAFSLALVVIQIIMAIAANKGERKKVPYIGDKIEEMLK